MKAVFEAMRARVERALEAALPEQIPELGGEAFQAAVVHAVKGGGKRVRPILTLLCAQACGAQAESKEMTDAEHAAAAIELLHNYTLVHDDLPCMDNDTERRGAPSVWAKFGEGEAVLVGDYLQALAFAQVAKCQCAGALLPLLARAAGQVICGQVADIAAAKVPKQQWLPSLLGYVFVNKTAMLIQTACELGAVAAGASESEQAALAEYGANVGLAFQYVHDLLDAAQAKEGNELNAIAVYAGEPALVRASAEYCTRRALKALAEVPGDTSALEGFAKSLLDRLN